MHTVWVRLNAVFFFGLTVLLCLSLLAALSKINHTSHHQPAIHTLQLNTMKSLKNHGGVDRALLSFDLHVSRWSRRRRRAAGRFPRPARARRAVPWVSSRRALPLPLSPSLCPRRPT